MLRLYAAACGERSSLGPPPTPERSCRKLSFWVKNEKVVSEGKEIETVAATAVREARLCRDRFVNSECVTAGKRSLGLSY